MKTKGRNQFFNTYLRYLTLLLFLYLICACSSVQKTDVSDLAVEAAIKLAQPALEKIFLAQAPVSPSSRSLFPVVNDLPGQHFNRLTSLKKSIDYDSKGNLSLLPGDYIIPVMTYCMRSSGSSPDGQSYVLGLLQGSKANIIREINIRAIPQYSSGDVQILSWSIQNGLSYGEMTEKSREIIDKIVPELKSQLQESFLENFSEKWNQLPKATDGVIPDFGETSDALLRKLGELGSVIVEMRQFREKIKAFGNDYSTLSRFITITHPDTSPSATPWNKISDSVYARFITKGHFQNVGQIELRVLPGSLQRKVNSLSDIRAIIDMTSWVADPGSGTIQPLSFSPLYGWGGLLITSEIAESPAIAAAILGAILAAKIIDWDAFYETSKITREVQNSVVQKLLQEGTSAIREEHDELEKPARELEIIDNKTKDTSSDKRNPVREYSKSGGEPALEEDFKKIPQKVEKADGVEFKTLPDGVKVVKRPITDHGPTLEFQPLKTNSKLNNRLRIKVRYLTE